MAQHKEGNRRRNVTGRGTNSWGLQVRERRIRKEAHSRVFPAIRLRIEMLLSYQMWGDPGVMPSVYYGQVGGTASYNSPTIVPFGVHGSVVEILLTQSHPSS